MTTAQPGKDLLPLDEFLKNYIRYIGVADLRDKAIVKSLLGRISHGQIAGHVVSILKGREKDEITNTLCFVRDLYLSPALGSKQKRSLMRALEDAGLFRILDRMLYSKLHRHRSDSIYTIGKLSNPRYHPNLFAAFEKFYSKRDPHLVSHLVFEINWLNRRSRYQVLAALANHKNYLFRWAALGLDNCYDFKNRKVKRILSALENDPVKIIREQYQEKILNGIDVPKLDYSGTEVFIGNFLSINEYDSYSMGLLKRIFDFYVKNIDDFLKAIRMARGDSDGILHVYRKIDRVIKRGGNSWISTAPAKKK